MRNSAERQFVTYSSCSACPHLSLKNGAQVLSISCDLTSRGVESDTRKVILQFILINILFRMAATQHKYLRLKGTSDSTSDKRLILPISKTVLCILSRDACLSPPVAYTNVILPFLAYW